VALADERQVLGCLLHGRDIDTIARLAPVAAFHGARHQLIAELVYALHDAGAPVGPTAVAGAMFDRGLAGRHDPAYLIELYARCESWTAGPYFADRVRRHAILRDLHVLGRQLLGMATLTDLDDVPDIAHEATSRITRAVHVLTSGTNGNAPAAVPGPSPARSRPVGDTPRETVPPARAGRALAPVPARPRTIRRSA
jgi:replicative DNA helicase